MNSFKNINNLNIKNQLYLNKILKENMSSFYLCPEINCNRKYKTKNKLIDHLLQIHKIIAHEVGEPVEITKENKKNVENMKNNIKRVEQREFLIKEA